MTNILSDDKRQDVLALGRLGWTLRRIQQATGVRRETASAYLKAAGLAVRPPGRWGHPVEILGVNAPFLLFHSRIRCATPSGCWGGSR